MISYGRIALGTIAFFVSSFVLQGVLGFAVGGAYFASIPAMRTEPLVHLGMIATLIMGVAFSSLYARTAFRGSAPIRGLKYGLLVGMILVPFLALDIPGRFEIASVGAWMAIQGVLGMLHFAIAGVLVGIIYRNETN